MFVTLQTFAGNREVIGRVEQMLSARRVPQTLIIEGPAGSGRKTLAGLIAAGLLCTEGNPPCGQCAACRLVQSGHPDVTWVTPLKDKAAISVDQVRSVRLQAAVKPNQGSHRIFIFDGTLNDAAQNALLKLLEEPPAFAVFMILCPHRTALIPTVVSRGTVLTLTGVSYEEALPALAALGLPEGEETRRALAAANGILGDILQAVDPAETAHTAARKAALALAEGNRADFIRATAPLRGERGQLPAFYEELYRLLFAALSGESREPAQQLARRLPRARLLQMAATVAEDQKILPLNPNVGLLLTGLCARLTEQE